LLVRELMTGVSEGGIPILISIAVIFAFVLTMVAITSYVFTREVNKPF
jgi:ABC-2 type transport system permease protein